MKTDNLMKLIDTVKQSGEVPSNIDKLVEQAMHADYRAFLSDSNLTETEFTYLDFVKQGMQRSEK